MNDAPADQPLPPELDADGQMLAPMHERDRMQLTGVAAELAALTTRTEHASAEVAAIEVRMQGLVEELTTMAGVSAEPTTKPTA